MNIIYSNHANEKIVERKISKSMIENSLKNPDAVMDSRGGTKVAHKLINDKLLRIVYKAENKTCVVISAYYTHPERYEEKI